MAGKGTEAETKEERCFLALSSCLHFTIQAHLPTCSRLALSHIHRNEENVSTDMAISQSDAYTLPQLRFLLPRHIYFMLAWQEQIMTESVCYIPLEPSNISLSRLHCDPSAIFLLRGNGILHGWLKSTFWSKTLVMCFRFLHMWQWQFLFHSWRGVDFVHLKCFRYFEGSKIRFFGDCERFEESSSFFFFFFEEGWGGSEWYGFLLKIRMDIFEFTQHVLSWR